ncbi:hypothetical protein Glove_274g39 [Diversispora epigaea]|uniref:Uncharacterized protein n=1 Tax=Diversispora epigaea TaxID=1348612 RepID=A0A397IBN7_9GLOM|nr:hypothetical protein Glove_274g39 [Diversispora epigaea]
MKSAFPSRLCNNKRIFYCYASHVLSSLNVGRKESRAKVRGLLLPNQINTQATDFTKYDVEALRVKFQPATEDHVIPDGKVEEFSEQFICRKINRNMLKDDEFNVDNISDLSDSLFQTFFEKLAIVTQNPPGIPESSTDTMVDDLLRIAKLNNHPLKLMIHPPSKLHILNEPYVSATPEFVVDKRKISMIITEDKTLRNINHRNEYGEMQIAAEILSCGDENIRKLKKDTDQVLFAVRFISTYATFYKAQIPAEYWEELIKGLPKVNSVEIKRWPGENDDKSGLDLADPDGRKAVLTALTKIRQFILK